MAIDYLQLIETEVNNNFNTRLHTVIRELKQLAIELDCPILVLSQLSRSVEKRQDHYPRISDLKEYNELEEIADEIWLLYRDEYYNPDSEFKGIAELTIGKNKHGRTGCIELSFAPDYASFSNIERKKKFEDGRCKSLISDIKTI